MTRKRLNLAYINNDSIRKTTFNKRKKGILKKINELSVLCGVEACMVINSPFLETQEVWPSDEGAKNVVEKFRGLPDGLKSQRMVDHETFLKEHIEKIHWTNYEKRMENVEKMMKEIMFQLLAGKGEMLSLNDGNRLEVIQYMEKYIKKLHHHREKNLNQPPFEYEESSSTALVTAPNQAGSSALAPTEVSPLALVPGTILEVGSSSSAPKSLTEVASPSLAPWAITKVASPSLTPWAITEGASLTLGPGATTEAGSLALVPRARSEVGFSFLAPRATTEVGLSSSVNTFSNNSLSIANDQQGYYSMMNQDGVKDQHTNVDSSQYHQQFGYPYVVDQEAMHYRDQPQFGYPPIVGQDGMKNLNHDEKEVHQKMNNNEQMGFPFKDDNNQNNKHQS